MKRKEEAIIWVFFVVITLLFASIYVYYQNRFYGEETAEEPAELQLTTYFPNSTIPLNSTQRILVVYNLTNIGNTTAKVLPLSGNLEPMVFYSNGTRMIPHHRGSEGAPWFTDDSVITLKPGETHSFTHRLHRPDWEFNETGENYTVGGEYRSGNESYHPELTITVWEGRLEAETAVLRVIEE